MKTTEATQSWGWRIKKTGQTQGAFAETVGVSQGALSRYITGTTHPRIDIFDAIESKLIELGV